MTKIIQSKYKVSRRLKISIWGNDKDPFHVKNFCPGQHGAKGKIKVSDYAIHLKAKQTIKNHYGRITEKQFKNIFKKAIKMKGNTAENFAGLLESRIDMIIYRMNLAPTIFSARQLVSHGNVKINGQKINIPSIKLKAEDTVELKDTAKQIKIYKESIKKQERRIPEYLLINKEQMSGKYIRIPLISDIPYPFKPNFSKVIEYYSR